MPFDGTNFAKSKLSFLDELQQEDGGRTVINYLERGLERVTAGYCAWSFHRPKTWYRRAPKFCMSGALNFTDDGAWESYRGHYTRQDAERLLRRFTGGRGLVDFGTRPFIRRRVIRAYRLALEAARLEHA